MVHILVTNDDGVFAPGLLALAREMQKIARVTILAPDRNWSSSGHVKTLSRPLRVKEVLLDGGIPALASDGAPSDCVAIALLGFIKEEIDLVVSGINPVANLGSDLTYSGTVTAVMEAMVFGKPGIAFSIDGLSGPPEFDFSEPAGICRKIVSNVLEQGLPPGVLLNVNLPYLPEKEIKGYQVTRQGKRVYRDLLDARIDPMGRPYYWIGGEVPTGVPDDGTDIGALFDGYISITPIHLDLTAHPWIDRLKDWRWG